MSDVAAEIDAIFKRDAEFFRVISSGFRPVVFVGFDALDDDTRDAVRKQTDAALIAAIKRIGR